MALAPHTSGLLPRIASGDPDAMRAAINTYGNLVWSLARTFTNSDAEAEEAVHEVFVDLWRKSTMYNSSLGSEATFITVITRRALIDRWRRVSTRTSHELLAASQRPIHAVTATADDELRTAASALAELAEDQRHVLQLSIGHGQSHEEIAKVTGMPLGTVKAHLRRGLAKIRDSLAKRLQPTHLRSPHGANASPERQVNP
jgi:RNA polymerase sigma-70 factor, ECF subfamily